MTGLLSEPPIVRLRARGAVDATEDLRPAAMAGGVAAKYDGVVALTAAVG